MGRDRQIIQSMWSKARPRGPETVTRDEARALLASGTDVSYDSLDQIFLAFGFSSEFEAPDVTVYFHRGFIGCGIFRARDRYDWGIITPAQRTLVGWMVECVAVNERRRAKP